MLSLAERRKAIVFLAGFLLLFFSISYAGVYFWLNSRGTAESLRLRVESELRKATGWNFALGKIGPGIINRVAFSDVRVSFDATRPQVSDLSAKQVVVSYNLFKLLASRDVLASIYRIDLVGPRLRLSRDASGRWNLQTALERLPSGTGKAPSFSSTVIIRGGEITIAGWNPRESGWLKWPGFDLFEPEDRSLDVKFSSIDGRLKLGQGPALNLRLVARSSLDPGALLAVDGNVQSKGGLALRVQANGLGLKKPFGVASYNPRYGRFQAGRADLDVRLQRPGERAALGYSARIDLNQARYILPGTDLYTDIRSGRILFGQAGKVNGDLDARYAGANWRISGGFTAGGSRVKTVDLAVKATGLGLDEVAATLEKMGLPVAGVKVAGKADVNARIKGDWPEVRLFGNANLSGAAVDDASMGGPVDGITGEVAFNGDGARLNGMKARYLGAEVSIGGRVTDLANPRLALEIGVHGMELGAFRLAGAGPAGKEHHVTLKESGVDGRVDLEARVEGPLTRPEARGQLKLEAGEIGGLAVPELQAGFAYSNLEFRVDPFTAQMAGGTFTGNFTSRFTGGIWQYEATGKATSFQIAELGRLWPQARALDPQGRLGGDLLVKGTYSSQKIADLAGTVTAEDLTMGGLPLGELKAGFTAHDRSVILDYAVLSGPNGQISAGGRLNPDGQMAVDLAGEGIDLGRILEETGRWAENGSAREVLKFIRENGAGGMLKFVGQVSGPARAPVLAGSFQVDNPSLRGQKFDHLAGQVSLSGRDLGFKDLELARDKARYVVSGEMGIGPAPELALSLRVKDARAEELMDIAGLKWGLSGEVNGELTVDGPSGAPVVDGTFQMARGQFLNESFEALSSGFRYEAGTLLVKSLDARLAGGAVTAGGALTGQRLNFSVGARGVNLAGLAFLQGVLGPSQGRVQGPADLTGTVTGTLKDPQLTGHLHTGPLQIREYPIEGVDGELRYAGQKVRFEDLGVRFAGGRTGIRGEIALAPVSLDLLARTEDADLGRLLVMAGARPTAPVKGRVAGSVQVQGRPENPSVQIAAQLRDGLIGKMAAFGDLDARLEDHAITVRQLRLSQGKGLLSAAGVIGLQKEIAFQAEAKDFDLDAVGSLLGLPHDLRGRANVEVSIKGDSANPEARLALNIADSSINGVAFERAEGHVAVKDRVATIQDMTLARDGQKAKVYGEIPLAEFMAGLSGARAAGEPARPLDLHVEVPDGDLGWMGAFYKDLRVQKGTGSLKLHITGPLRQPQVAGEMWMKGATVSHPALGADLTNLSAEAVIRGNLVEIKKASANWNGGEIAISGGMELAGLKPANYDLTGKISGVHYPDPFLDMVIDGNVRLAGPAILPVISGEAFLSRTRLTLGAQRKSRGKALFNAKLDLVVKNRDEVHIVDTIGATDAWAYGELALRGTLREPTLAGRADATRGTFGYLDADFQITDAYAEFTPQRGLLPLVNVRGETKVDNYTVTAIISGVVGNLSMDFSAIPALSRDEIMSILGLPGRINRVFRNRSNPDGGGSLNSELAELLQEQIQTQVFGSLRKAVKEGLQLDDFRIEPGIGEEKLRFQFGKYVFNNLYVTYSRTFSSQPLDARKEDQFAQQFIKFEYRIQPNILFSTSFTDKGDTRLGLEAKLRF
ncbi:MAG: translocation/assembly module TamB domain-containing protein [Firmicutes bacterium]|nr:translocation/assembly module TamB domain-containing protein [Bacillota bacterium]